MRVLLAFMFVAIGAFCSFGFLAAHEPLDGALAWRIGYGVAIILCIYCALRLFRGGREKS